jgi:hypothetical protein
VPPSNGSRPQALRLPLDVLPLHLEQCLHGSSLVSVSFLQPLAHPQPSIAPVQLIPNPASPQSSSSSAWPCFNSQLILGTAYVPYFGPVSSVHLSTALLHFGCSRPDYHNGSLFHGLGTSSPARRLLFTCMTFPSPFCL